MIGLVEVPPDCRPFHEVFREYIAARPQEEHLTGDAVAFRAAQDDLDAEFFEFCSELQGISGAALILSHDPLGTLRVLPAILHHVEPLQAMLGWFWLRPDRGPIASTARAFEGAGMFLPDATVTELRRRYPGPLSHTSREIVRVRMTIEPGAFRLAGQQPSSAAPDQAQGTGSEALATRMIVAAYDRGEIRVKEDARQIVGEKLSARAFERACSAAKAERPGIWKSGRPPRLPGH